MMSEMMGTPQSILSEEEKTEYREFIIEAEKELEEFIDLIPKDETTIKEKFLEKNYPDFLERILMTCQNILAADDDISRGDALHDKILDLGRKVVALQEEIKRIKNKDYPEEQREITEAIKLAHEVIKETSNIL